MLNAELIPCTSVLLRYTEVGVFQASIGFPRAEYIQVVNPCYDMPRHPKLHNIYKVPPLLSVFTY